MAEAVGFEPTSLYDHGFQDRCNNHSATLPFLIFQRTLSFNLLRRVESNYRPPDYETDELPLLYPAIFIFLNSLQRYVKFLTLPNIFAIIFNFFFIFIKKDKKREQFLVTPFFYFNIVILKVSHNKHTIFCIIITRANKCIIYWEHTFRL